MATTVTKQPVKTNHILHLLLTVFTAGFWLPVWIIVAIVNSFKSETIVSTTTTE